MSEYHKIQSIYKRDTKGKFLFGDWATDALGYLKDLKWLWDEKIDGTNIRIIWDGTMLKFGGRTERAQIPVKLLDALSEQFQSEMFFNKFGTDPVTLYGEGYGAKIQKGGGNYRPDNGFVMFDVKIGDFWLKRDDVCAIGDGFNVDIAPHVGSGTIEEAVEFTRQGFQSDWGDFQAEGLVLRPATQLFDRQGKRIITKVKVKDFKI